MKKHAIIPIFIPHKGCPHDCIFCNQKKITAHIAPVTAEDVVDTIDTWLTTLGDVETVEVAFYGGSFTAIPMVNSKTTAVRVIPAIGLEEGQELDFGGLLGSGPVMKLRTKSPAKMINRGGRIPAPMQSLKN